MLNRYALFGLTLGALCLTACGGEKAGHIDADAPKAVPAAAPAPAPQTPAPAPAPAAPSPEFASLPAPYVDSDYARGKRMWRQCSSCHTVAEEADHLVGPNLYGLFGRQIGSAAGFNYSNALKEADFIWTPEKLDEWLTNPRNFLPGNNMSFAGVRKPEDRASVIAYLMIESGWRPE